MGIIKQYDKRSGITYAYESHAYWDSEKKMSRAKRTLLGRIDPETGEIVPTDGRNRKKKEEKPTTTPSLEDYKEMYEKLLKKYEAQEQIIKSLQEKIKKMECKEK
jgi:hypothetical protein